MKNAGTTKRISVERNTVTPVGPERMAEMSVACATTTKKMQKTRTTSR